MKVYARRQKGKGYSLVFCQLMHSLKHYSIKETSPNATKRRNTKLFITFRYYDVLRRHNYVTPTSYLELILTFKTLLGVKQSEILGLKNRYVTGLEKLEFAASQVSVMQEELTALQPELIQTSAETEKLMVKIEQDTVEVEAKKEVRLFKYTLLNCFLSYL